METLKERKQNFIDDLKYQKWEATITMLATKEILPKMQEAKNGIQSKIDISKEFITRMGESPTKESREKRQKEEKELKVLEAKMEYQDFQIFGGKKYNPETKRDEMMFGVIQKIEGLGTTINNLATFIGVAEKQ